MIFLNDCVWQVADSDSDEEDSPAGHDFATQPLHVLPFYSLLSAERQAKVRREPSILLCLRLVYFCFQSLSS